MNSRRIFDVISTRLSTVATAGLLVFAASFCEADDEFVAGPIYSDYSLTLEPGRQTNMMGPFWQDARTDEKRVWAINPILSYEKHEEGGFEEFDILFPLAGYHQIGGARRYHLFHLLNYTTSDLDPGEEHDRKITFFPFFFHKRSIDPDENYTGLLPFYGTVKDRLLRKEVKWAMWPLYIRSDKADFRTYNYLYPIFHYRTGEHIKGWQVWPVVGSERREPSTRLDQWGEEFIVPGHTSHFAIWPIYSNVRGGIGTTNTTHQLNVLPFYSKDTSPARSRHTYLWPFFNFKTDRAQDFQQVDVPWPLVTFARGEGKHESRVLPFYNRLSMPGKEREVYMWPLWMKNRIVKDPLEMERLRILFFLYSDRRQTNLDTGDEWRYRDLWPFFTWRRDPAGNTSLQLLALWEPLSFNHPGIARNYSNLWSIWRTRYNAETSTRSHSLLWNTYRRSVSPTEKKVSLLFGLFQYHSTPEQTRWRVFYIPFGRGQTPREGD